MLPSIKRATVALQTRESAAASYILSITRIVFGILFLCHGLQKTFGLFGGVGGHAVHLATRFGVAGLLETVGGTLIILGLLTRPVAFVLCGEMAFAYFTSHFPRGPLPLKNLGEPAVLNCFFFLYLIFSGAGALSLDALMRRRS
jgi:putative oxidoreductase